MGVTTTRSTSELVEIGKIIWPDCDRLPDLPEQKNCNCNRASSSMILGQPIHRAAAKNEQCRINWKDVTLADVQTASNGATAESNHKCPPRRKTQAVGANNFPSALVRKLTEFTPTRERCEHP